MFRAGKFGGGKFATGKFSLTVNAVSLHLIMQDNGDGTGRIIQYPTCPQISVTDNGDGTGKVDYA